MSNFIVYHGSNSEFKENIDQFNSMLEIFLLSKTSMAMKVKISREIVFVLSKIHETAPNEWFNELLESKVAKRKGFVHQREILAAYKIIRYTMTNPAFPTQTFIGQKLIAQLEDSIIGLESSIIFEENNINKTPKNMTLISMEYGITTLIYGGMVFAMGGAAASGLGIAVLKVAPFFGLGISKMSIGASTVTAVSTAAAKYGLWTSSAGTGSFFLGNIAKACSSDVNEKTDPKMLQPL
jgi:hypothetical protein